ncbi:hypothetical protein FP026_09335 [Rhizobium tropici]|uniref:Uncharacterized protein n=1 Tax=Rhizobium tropici TaxID=398 RepID=A0A5B0W648_RHITR|nr:hypothetical protein [Rhizobium tropici]KAA1182277.1 hypothetical protein FP026_09335 [Rhizobium tropici]
MTKVSERPGDELGEEIGFVDGCSHRGSHRGAQTKLMEVRVSTRFRLGSCGAAPMLHGYLNGHS